jgi:hypothetical protein
MPFPFLPVGVALALAVLGGALALFGLALKALDWTIDTAKGSMLGGVVSGLRTWDVRSSARRARRAISPVSPFSGGEPLSLIESTGGFEAPLERIGPTEARRGRTR